MTDHGRPSAAHPLPPLPLDEDYLPCRKCGNLEPVRLDRTGCDACSSWPTCYLCGRWTDLADSPPTTALSLADGRVVDVCDLCREKAS